MLRSMGINYDTFSGLNILSTGSYHNYTPVMELWPYKADTTQQNRKRGDFTVV
jgi:hypothetical protein